MRTLIGVLFLASGVFAQQFPISPSGAANNVYCAGAGTNTITCAGSPVPTSYTGMMLSLLAGGTNTGAVTINVASLGAVGAVANGSPLAASQLASGDSYLFYYAGGAFNLLATGPTGPVGPAAGLGDFLPVYTTSQSVQSSWCGKMVPFNGSSLTVTLANPPIDQCPFGLVNWNTSTALHVALNGTTLNNSSGAPTDMVALTGSNADGWTIWTDGSNYAGHRALGPTGPTGSGGATGVAGAGYAASSTTSLAIGTGNSTFTTQAGLAYSTGARTRAASAANTANYMEGLVTSYSGTSLVINVDTVGGSGTHADWNLNASGNVGATGPQGPTGASGSGSGTVNTGATDNAACYVGAGTTVGPCPAQDIGKAIFAGTGGGAAQSQTASLSPAATSLTNLHVCWLPAAANTAAAPTLAVNGLTATAITKNGTIALVANDLTTSAIACAWYDGTEFQLQNPQTAPANAMVTNGGNTVTTGDQNLAGAASFEVPVSAGATAGADGRIDYDSTNKQTHLRTSGADSTPASVLVTGTFSESKSCGVSSATPVKYTSTVTIPTNSITQLGDSLVFIVHGLYTQSGTEANTGWDMLLDGNNFYTMLSAPNTNSIGTETSIPFEIVWVVTPSAYSSGTGTLQSIFRSTTMGFQGNGSTGARLLNGTAATSGVNLSTATHTFGFQMECTSATGTETFQIQDMKVIRQ